MTFEEARAQFPVLERYAYLQAGSVGPLARANDRGDARRRRSSGSAKGRGSLARFTRLLEMREELRADVAALVGVDVEHVALTASTTDGCNIVLAGLDLGPGDEVITTTDEHFGLLGPLHASGARVVVVGPGSGAHRRGGHAAHAAHRALARPLDDGRGASRCTSCGLRPALPILVDGAQSVGVIPVDASGLDYYTISGQKWLCGPEGTGALVVADPDGLRVGAPELPLAGRLRAGRDVRAEGRRGALRPEPHAEPHSAGLRAAIRGDPRVGVRAGGRDGRALPVAAARRRVRRRRAGGARDARLLARSGGRVRDVVARLAEAGVIVRDLPGRGLVRASVGWWTNDDDLERLVGCAL